MLKFRSMRRDAEGETGPIWASNHDVRCTPIGAWLRRTNIDELPQLVNVFRGEMSLVGPRPERPVFVERFRTTVPDYDLRHAVPGGMTGWAQVHGWRGRTSLRKRIQYDLDYIQRWSFWFDLRVLLMTVQHVVWGKTSWTSPKRGPER
jgi:lipopolysaccharide/colanic/teichoic acid biosynthesis glycosyltransferase